MKTKKILAVLTAAALAVGMMGGCKTGKGNEANADSVKLTIANWPDETDPERVALYDGFIQKMKSLYPNIEIIPDTYKYDTQTFMAKASSGQLPTMFDTWFTEVGKIIDAGYAADVTENMKKAGFYDKLNPDVKELVQKNGKMYAIPQEAYAQGLFINKSLFEKAGYKNADGSYKVPKTWEELGEMAGTIKEKTGVAGFIMPATNNCGGWHFLNMAWANGGDFVAKEGGKWVSKLDCEGAVKALQFIKDLKWKYNALGENIFIDVPEMQKLFATNQGAMYISNPPSNDLILNYEMSKDNLMAVSMPAGEKGSFAQMGGNVHMFAPNATPEQIDAGLKWIEVIGEGPELTEESINSRKEKFKNEKDNGLIVLDKEAFSVWESPQRDKKMEEIRSEYTNIDPKDYEGYYAFENVTVNPEPEMCAQELYGILDTCIQNVLTDKNADCATIIKKASNDYQVNCLDKAE